MCKPILGLVVSLSICAALVIEAPLRVAAASQPLLVVVAASSAVKGVTLGELRRAFLGEVVTVEGRRLIAINHPLAAATREQFDSVVLALKPHEVGRFWVDRAIRGQTPPPKSVQSPELAVRIVMSVPGAITYTTADRLTEKLRAVTVDGKAAGQSGYPLN